MRERTRGGSGTVLGFGLSVLLALLACKKKQEPPPVATIPTCNADGECPSGQVCLANPQGLKTCQAVPEPEAPKAPPKPKDVTECAVVALSGLEKGKPFAISGKCDITVKADGERITSSCPMSFRGKGGNIEIELDKQDEKDGKARFRGTARGKGATISLLLYFDPDQMGTFANGQATLGKDRITCTFRPCKT